ncbi:hypothetical protein E3N88_17054 [Mikania micrantha]|uniref:Uncharacterized protein n=1 Tax=Mikania micrantha TaxID=192012 RepID=A0A5N6NTH5_9ASTR|nr:hypothetical protein E3N88_17054 [Mikania micrantha]
MSEQEQNMVHHLTEQHMEPRNILSSLKKQNPDNVSIRRDRLVELEAGKKKLSGETMNTLITIFFFIFLHIFTTPSASYSNSIVKNLPGFHGDLPFTLETGCSTTLLSLKETLCKTLFFRSSIHRRWPWCYCTLSFALSNRSHENQFQKFNMDKPYIRDQRNIMDQDIPAYTGFSYSKTWETSRSSDTSLAFQCYEFLQKWLLEYPRFLNNPLYIAGISYMGIVIPVTTLEIYKGNEHGSKPQLNIKGCICVSPLTDKFNDFNSRLEFAHRLALISDDIYESAKKTCNGNYINSNPNNIECSNDLQRMDECTSGLNIGNILYPVCDPVDLNPICDKAAKTYLENWANYKDVQKALHVREGTIETWHKNNESLRYDMNKEDTVYYSYDIFSSVDYHRQLIARNSQVLVLNGDHDMNFPYVGTERWIKSLDLPIESPWNPWFVNNQVAGYKTTFAKNGYTLTYATIKGAGHGVALYKPDEALAIVDAWLSSRDYLSDL